jgi:hypothetical protein
MGVQHLVWTSPKAEAFEFDNHLACRSRDCSGRRDISILRYGTDRKRLPQINRLHHAPTMPNYAAIRTEPEMATVVFVRTPDMVVGQAVFRSKSFEIGTV